MSPTHLMLCWVQKRMSDLHGWASGPSARYRRHYRRLARAETYLIHRTHRSA